MSKKCEICGQMKPESDFSKAYKHRCKQCVAEQERQKRQDKKNRAVDTILYRDQSSLYNKKWVKTAAESGYIEFLEIVNGASKDAAKRIEHNNFWFELLYYSAFEKALNTFFRQVLDDTMCNVNLYIDELHEITATFNIDDSTK